MLHIYNRVYAYLFELKTDANILIGDENNMHITKINSDSFNCAIINPLLLQAKHSSIEYHSAIYIDCLA